jgi:hypothetical protein
MKPGLNHFFINLQIFISEIFIFSITVLLCITAFFFIYKYFQQRILVNKAVEKTKMDLNIAYIKSQSFGWFRIKKEIIACIHDIAKAIGKGNIQHAHEHVSPVFINFLQLRIGKKIINSCPLLNQEFELKVLNIRPLFFFYNNKHLKGNESKLTMLIKARATKVSGTKTGSKKIIGSIWTFQLINQKWVLYNIENNHMLLDFVKRKNEVPEKIEVEKKKLYFEFRKVPR